jgi:hypothetical protein
MKLIAKPVIDNQFWILQENDRKIGNVEACAGGYQIKINNQTAQFKTIRMLERHVDVKFEPAVKNKKPVQKQNLVHGYPTTGKIFNPVWDIKMQLPIFTKTSKSKSWFAAGWYVVKKGRAHSVIQDPKLIVLQRYPYHGPFYTKEQADEHTSTKIY